MRVQHGNSHIAHLRGNYQPRTLDLARDIMQLHVYLVPHGRNHPAGNYSLLPDSNPHTCSHDVTRALKKTNLAIRGILHASTCASLVRNLHRAPCEQSTPCRSRRVSHTCSRKNPSVPNSLPSLTFVRPRDQLLTACVSGPGLPSQPCTRRSRP